MAATPALLFLPTHVHLLDEEGCIHGGVHPLLACGHYGGERHRASSFFDFPEDGAYCSECQTVVPAHPRLVQAIEDAWRELDEEDN